MKMAVRSTPSTSQNRIEEPSWSLIRLVAPTGTTKNRPTASTSDSTIVAPQVNPPICGASSSPSSGSIWALAEIASARKPIFNDSASATTPRITGKRSTRWRLAQETRGSELTATSPSGFRTATAQMETPRIITPSRTACPPTGASRSATGFPSGMRVSASCGRPFISGAPSAATLSSDTPSPAIAGAFLPTAAGCAAPEPLDPAPGIDKLLLAGVEGMAGGADLDVELRLGGARIELVATRATDVCQHVIGVDSSLHLHRF